MKSRQIARLIGLLSLMGAAGCGGGNGGASQQAQTVQPKVSVAWPARSRQIPAPQSALSVSITLKNAQPDGSDLVLCFDRDNNAAAHVQSYTATGSGVVGAHHFVVVFYADPGCAGAAVANAEGDMTLNADGTGLPDIAYASLIASVTVDPGQSVTVGQARQLTFTAKNASNQVVAVSAGSVNWTVVTGQSFLQFSAGQASGVAAGTASVTATIDGHVSAAQNVTVVAQPTYTFVDVHAGLATQFGAANSEAMAINVGGDAAGTFVKADNTQHAFLRTAAGTLTDLGVGTARAINTAGKVVGDGASNAVLWSGGGTMSLPPLNGDVQSQAYGINDSDVVVGASLHAQGENSYTPVYWTISGGVATPHALPVPAQPGGYGFAYGINNNGQIAGSAYTGTSGPRFALLWDPGASGYAFRSWTQNSVSEALALNASGVSAGYVFNVITRATRFHLDGTRDELAHPTGAYSIAKGINSGGDIVGQSATHPEIWTASGSALDLDTASSMTTSGGNTRADGVNDAGHVVGTRFLNGKFEAFLLTPL